MVKRIAKNDTPKSEAKPPVKKVVRKQTPEGNQAALVAGNPVAISVGSQPDSRLTYDLDHLRNSIDLAQESFSRLTDRLSPVTVITAVGAVDSIQTGPDVTPLQERVRASTREVDVLRSYIEALIVSIRI